MVTRLLIDLGDEGRPVPRRAAQPPLVLLRKRHHLLGDMQIRARAPEVARLEIHRQVEGRPGRWAGDRNAPSALSDVSGSATRTEFAFGTA